MTTINSDGGTGLNGYFDTLAQSFFVDRPLYVTKVNLFFNTKDSEAPVELNFRTMENGLPSDQVVTNSRVLVSPSSINTSSNSSVETSFIFDSPVFLDAGQYALALSTASKNHTVYVADLGSNDITTDSVISKQPYSGTLFVSANGITWEQRLNQDLKFKMFRADFSSTSAVVDFILQKNTFTSVNITNLGLNPFKSYNAISTLKVYHNRHGFNSGDRVTFYGLPRGLEYTGNANAVVTFNGIDYDKLSNVEFTVSNVSSSTYTVNLNTTAGETANIVPGRFGGTSVMASTNVPFTTIYPALSTKTPPRTSVTNKVKTTDTSYTVSGFETINPDAYDFDGVKLLVDKRNRDVSMSSAESFVYRAEMTSSDSYVSPTITIPFSSVLFVTPDINDPSSSLNLPQDLVPIASANTLFSFASDGTITVGGGDEQANVKTITPGAFVTITGAGDPTNNGTFRVVFVESDGSKFKIPSANAEPAGNVISITYRPEFVSDEASFATSSRAKYVTRKIDLATPATALVVRFSVSKPTAGDIELYYKVSSDETESFANKPYTPIDLGVVASSVRGQFVEIEKFIENIPEFSSAVIKIVLKSDDISKYPIVKDLRIIALE